MEPLESVEQQNALVETERADQQEIQRLFAELTGHVRAAGEALAAAEEAIGILDFLQRRWPALRTLQMLSGPCSAMLWRSAALATR